MDQQNKLAISLLTAELWTARRFLKDKQSSLQSAVEWRYKAESQVVRAKADEERLASDCDLTAEKIKELQGSITQLGGKV